MKRLTIIAGAFLLGVAVMLAILQPWKRTPRPAPPTNVGTALLRTGGDPFVQANQLIEAGDLEQARRMLHTMLEKDPPLELGRAYAFLALVDIRSADPDSAQKQLAKAFALDPLIPELDLFQGHLDMLLKQYRAAVRSYTQALKQPRLKRARARAGRAAARFHLGEFAGAVEDATPVVDEEPDALFTRAAAYAELGRHEESLRDWTAYLAHNRRDAHAWMNRGNAHQRLGVRDAAVSDWKQAVKLDPRLGEQLEPLINR